MAKDTVIGAVLAELERFGVKGEAVLGSNHCAIWFCVGEDKLCYHCARSASDRRAMANARAHIRRTLKQYGLAPLN